jgi:hypothetical protein
MQHGHQWRTSRMPGDEFMRRFLQHVLPKGLHKVRYFGLWHPSRREQATRVRQFLLLDRPPAIEQAESLEMPIARRPTPRTLRDLVSVPVAEQGICCRSAASRQNGRKRHDIHRLRDRSEAGPDLAWRNRATVPLGAQPIPVPPEAPSRASSSSPDGVRSQSRRPVGATGALSDAASAPDQPTSNLKSP